MGFDLSFERPTCLAALKSSDRTKQSVCGWQYIYLCMYTRTTVYKRSHISLLLLFWIKPNFHCVLESNHSTQEPQINVRPTFELSCPIDVSTRSKDFVLFMHFNQRSMAINDFIYIIWPQINTEAIDSLTFFQSQYTRWSISICSYLSFIVSSYLSNYRSVSVCSQLVVDYPIVPFLGVVELLHYQVLTAV